MNCVDTSITSVISDDLWLEDYPDSEISGQLCRVLFFVLCYSILTLAIFA